MPIQIRRGAYRDFDPTKMVAGELADVMSGDPNTANGQSMYFAPQTGLVKRVALVEDVDARVYTLTDEVAAQFEAEVADSVDRAETAATNAAASATDARQHTPVYTDANSDGNIVITIGNGV